MYIKPTKTMAKFVEKALPTARPQRSKHQRRSRHHRQARAEWLSLDTSRRNYEICKGGGVSPAGKVNEMEEYHSRFDQDHIAECSDCYEAALDFAMEQEDEARLDAMAEASELEEA